MLKILLKIFKILYLVLGKTMNLHGISRKIFYDKWYMQALKLEELLKAKQWIYIGSGKDRRVWKRNNMVLKVAYTTSGVIANKQENFIYRNFKNDKINYAPCRLIQENLLMMVAVSPLDDLDPVQFARIPDWAFELDDGPQVGIAKDGRILAYDYAL
jgi:hypothetical protein